MKPLILTTCLLLSLAGAASAMQTLQTPPSSPAAAKAGNHSAIARNQNTQPTGEEVFKTNCARCHTPPSVISPRITGTIIMHMRTRARLSRQDEQLLLKYMTP